MYIYIYSNINLLSKPLTPPFTARFKLAKQAFLPTWKRIKPKEKTYQNERQTDVPEFSNLHCQPAVAINVKYKN